ncbi:type II toxin-antitoxin system VapC family toxin [Patulibacter sp. NPDC049589]|uniref:type II toxin-antitoxin system VapC family toxin n=1 Tax=Patulibacter sp. NPDC049589 TaxID=3154731 RepID=UPI0034404593
MIVLDTHAWIWWSADRDRLSTVARAAIDDAAEIGISAISAWEVAMLAERERIALDRPVASWVRQALTADPRTVEVPLTASIALQAVALGAEGMHADPADRFILASARHLGAALVTKDRALRAHDPARTVW